MIRDMQRGHVRSVERLPSLCEVLGLEFYIGPPRWRRVEEGGALPDVPLHALEQSARDLVRLSLLAGGNPIPEDLWPTFLAMARRELEVAQEERPGKEARTFGFVDRPDARMESYREQLLAKLFAERENLLPHGNSVSADMAGRVFIGRRIDEENAELV